jgi:hypothetical protein
MLGHLEVRKYGTYPLPINWRAVDTSLYKVNLRYFANS